MLEKSVKTVGGEWREEGRERLRLGRTVRQMTSGQGTEKQERGGKWKDGKNVGILERSWWCEWGWMWNVVRNAASKKKGSISHLWHHWQTFMTYVRGLLLTCTDLLNKYGAVLLACFFFPLWTMRKRTLSPAYVVIPNLICVCVCKHSHGKHNKTHLFGIRTFSNSVWDERHWEEERGERNDGYEEEDDWRLLWNVCSSGQDSTISFVRAWP